MRISRRALLCSAAALLLPKVANADIPKGFSQLKLGAGGLLTSLSIGSDGTTIARTDTYGAWIANPRTAGWRNSISATSMPSANDVGSCIEAVIAPSNPAIMYQFLTNGRIYKSTDRGAKWTETNFSTSAGAGFGNWGNKVVPKQYTPFMAIDPQNPNVVVVGVPSVSIKVSGSTSTSSAALHIPYVPPWLATGTPVFDNTTKQSVGTVRSTSAENRTATLTTNATSEVANGDVLLFGGGVYYTMDGGSTWTQISAASIPPSLLPAPWAEYSAGFLVAFDPTSSVANSVTQGIFVTSYGHGVYHTTAGPSGSWSLLAGAGGTMPTTFSSVLCDRFGNFWAVDASVAGGGANAGYLNVYPHSRNLIFTPERWSQPKVAGVTSNVCGVAIDSTVETESHSRIYAVGNNTGRLYGSTDGGASWFGPTTPSLGLNSGGISWVVDYARNTEGITKITFDPSVPNTLCATSGNDFWYTRPPAKATGHVWYEQGGCGTGKTGIEELVTNWIVSPPGGNPLVACWDKPVFSISNPNTYPAKFGPTNLNPIAICCGLDWASTSPSTIAMVGFPMVGTQQVPSVSSDGGNTWAPFRSLPGDGVIAGCIACSTATNWVWFPSNNGNPQYTTDGGAKWHSLGSYFNKNFEIPMQGAENGWGFAYYLNHQIVCADRVLANTFYAWNYGAPPSRTAGIYKSTDGGASWKKVYGNPAFRGNGGINTQLRSVPGNAGHLFYTPGNTEPDADLFRSINGGANWSTVTNVRGVAALGFGASKPNGSGYPSIFIYGKVGGRRGLYRSDDNAVTWIFLATYPNNSLDVVKCVEGDSNTWGTCYIGFGGSGAAKYAL